MQAQVKAKELMTSLGIKNDIKLNSYELIIASNLVRQNLIEESYMTFFIGIGHF